MAGDACIQEAGWKDFSFLGNRTVGESCRHGVAVLESHGLYARGSARHSHSATKVQVQILGKKLSEKEVVQRPIQWVQAKVAVKRHYRYWPAGAPAPTGLRGSLEASAAVTRETGCRTSAAHSLTLPGLPRPGERPNARQDAHLRFGRYRPR